MERAEQEVPREFGRERAADADGFVDDVKLLVDFPTMRRKPFEWVIDGELPWSVFEVFRESASAVAFCAVAVVVVLYPVAEGWDGVEVLRNCFGIFVFQVGDESFGNDDGVFGSSAEIGKELAALRFIGQIGRDALQVAIGFFSGELGVFIIQDVRVIDFDPVHALRQWQAVGAGVHAGGDVDGGIDAEREGFLNEAVDRNGADGECKSHGVSVR